MPGLTHMHVCTEHTSGCVFAKRLAIPSDGWSCLSPGMPVQPGSPPTGRKLGSVVSGGEDTAQAGRQAGPKVKVQPLVHIHPPETLPRRPRSLAVEL